MEPRLLRHFQQQFPCGGILDRRSGQPECFLPHADAATRSNHFEKCGTSRLCINCENLTELMGRAWHMGCAENALERLIRHGIQLTLAPEAPKIIALFTAGSPCNKISRGIWANFTPHMAKSSNKIVGPHATPSNAIWPWHEGLVLHCRMQQKLGYNQQGLTFAFQNPHSCSDNCSLADHVSHVYQFKI